MSIETISFLHITPSHDQFESDLKKGLNFLLKDIASEKIAEAIRYSILSGGKRLRPLLLLETAYGLPFFKEKNWNAACWSAISIELFHCFTLIHDDLPCMDNDDFRRGQPTNHKVYGEAMALLAGDLLQILCTKAYTLALSNSEISFEHWFKGLNLLLELWGPQGVMAGQAIEFGPIQTLQQVFKLHDLKTGALFKVSLHLPFILSNNYSSDFNAIQNFSHSFGRNFQIVDDIDDLKQDAGKPTSVFSYAHEISAQELLNKQRQELENTMSMLPEKFNPIRKRGEALLEKLQTL